jgi:protein SCO1/2
MVIEVRPGGPTVVISHRAIPGYMEAMVMPFRVRDARELAGLAPGDLITFDLVVGKKSSLVRNIRHQAGADKPDADLPRFEPPAERIEAGGEIPPFELTDQHGARFRSGEMRGRVAAVTFVYTRCPLPDVCPRLSANFAYLQKRFAVRLDRDLTLLSITLDPEHDTPEVLGRYARIWRARDPGWRLLTGAPREVERVAKWFGVVYWAEEGQIAHTTVTCVIGRNGRLAARVEGSAYPVRQLADLVEKELER